jgi:dTDP-4-dehydrorhamnose reductase
MKIERDKLLIVGASGLVGGYLFEYFGDRAIGTGHEHVDRRRGLIACDISDAEQVRRVISETGADAVIHCAAYTNVDGCERDPDRSYAVNVIGTRNVAQACGTAGVRYVFFSTDYVFGGSGGPHTLDEAFEPLSVYGRHKLEAERCVADNARDHAIVRSCNIYGWQPDGMNFVMAVYRLGLENKPMRVPVDQFGNPTLAQDMTAAVEVLVDSDEVGVFHFAGPDYVDRLEWAQRAALGFGLDPGFITGVATAELAQAAPRPLRGGLDARSTCRRLGVAFRGLDEGLATMRAVMIHAGIDLPASA